MSHYHDPENENCPCNNPINIYQCGGCYLCSCRNEVVELTESVFGAIVRQQLERGRRRDMLESENDALKAENAKLKRAIQQVEDWINRSTDRSAPYRAFKAVNSIPEQKQP